MAIFASTTTSNYSDPLKAQSIKALEARYKDMLAQQAQQPGITPENTQTPIQGFGHLANQFADSVRANRVDQAAAAQRDMLAKSMAGLDYGNPDPQRMAQIAVAAPDIYKDVAAAIEARRSQQAQFTHQNATAKEAARVAQEAADAAENRIQARPTDLPVVQADRALKRGEIDQATRDAIVKKATSAPASEQKYITGMQEQSIAGQSLIASLDEALALTNHPKGIYAGAGAGFAQGIGENTPKFLQGVTSAAGLDPETTSNTQRFNQIMGAQALDLLNQMKGASSDRDVQVNFKIVNDPNATIDNKRKAIEALKIKLAGLLQVHHNAITEAGGKVPTLPTAGGGGGTVTPAGPVSVASEAEALKLEPGTKFKLPDGRTGTAR